MALSITNLEYVSLNNKRMRTGKITFDSSYPTGGESLVPKDLGLDVIDAITFSGAVNATPAALVLDYDYTNQKLRAYMAGAATPAGTISKPTFTVEASGAIGANMEVGLSADSAAATFEGGTGITAQRTLTTTSPVGTPTFTGTAIAAAALAEVGNATNLSAYTCRFIAVGY